MTEQRLMKDGLGEDAVERIITALALSIPNFPVKQFRKDALNGIETLELKARVHHLIDVLHQYLPDDFEETAALLIKMETHWDYGDENDPLRWFAAWPVTDYVGVHGLEHPEISLNVLKHLTSLFSSEFAIRPFIKRHQAITFEHLKQWCCDQDEHVRRLASEGTRPRLPWGQQLPHFIADPAPVLPLLESLKDDASEYVRRSVANNLNDISKDHPDLVIETCQRWLGSASKEGLEHKETRKDRQWLVRHATRTLVKAGHSDVFALLGFTSDPKVALQSFVLEDAAIGLGESAVFDIVLQSTSSNVQKMVLDYAVHHRKKSGQLTAKVFKLRTLTLQPNASVEVRKAHAFKQITTRKYYSGEHVIELLINGVALGSVNFELSVP